MPDALTETSVALSFLLEALTLLDAPEHATITGHLLKTIDELSLERIREAFPPPGREAPSECANT